MLLSGSHHLSQAYMISFLKFIIIDNHVSISLLCIVVKINMDHLCQWPIAWKKESLYLLINTSSHMKAFSLVFFFLKEFSLVYLLQEI